MAQGSKKKYSPKQKRMAQHIEDSYKSSGASKKKAQRVGWATVNKKTGGAAKGSRTAETRPQAH